MKLTSEQNEKLASFIKSNWKSSTCFCCRSNNWNVAQEVFQVTEFSQGNFIIGGPVIPLIPITCNQCGNTILLNALVAGIVSPNPIEKKEEKTNVK